MELRNLVLHGRGCHSQTQGKEECFNSSLTREFLKYSTFENKVDAAQKLSEYRNLYNNKRSASRPESENAVFALFQKPDTFSEKSKCWNTAMALKSEVSRIPGMSPFTIKDIF